MSPVPGRVQASHKPPRPRAPLDWQQNALCRSHDPELFFANDTGRQTLDARRICLGCDVRNECLSYALTHNEQFGVWGGTTQDERAQLRRARAG